MSFWKGRRVLVTGGAGFIGSHLADHLVTLGAKVRLADRTAEKGNPNLSGPAKEAELLKTDLSDLDACRRAARGQDAAFHLAARVAGVAYNQAHPGTMFRDNVQLNLNALEAARLEGVERVLAVSSACVYRREAPVPTPETEGFVGEPDPTNFGYGWAKRALEVQARCYAEEFGMKIAVARPYNAYGPRDHFESENSHVIAAIVRRVFSGEDPLKVWGDGEQSRAFLHARDFAEGAALLLEKHPSAEPVNLGDGSEYKIKELVAMVLKASGKSPEVVFDPAKPAGQPRRSCDGSKAQELLGWKPRITLTEGLAETVKWYAANG